MAWSPVAEKLARHSFIEPNSGCQLWTGAVDSSGYGHIGVAKGVIRKAHRISYELAHGPIPPGLVICHKCDVPSCINPGHLFVGTDADNKADSMQKNRIAYGVRNGRAKLDDARAAKIREMIENGDSEREAASCFDVSRGTARAIKRGITWKPERLKLQ